MNVRTVLNREARPHWCTFSGILLIAARLGLFVLLEKRNMFYTEELFDIYMKDKREKIYMY